MEAWLPFGLNKTDWAQRVYKPSRDLLMNFIRDSLERALEDYHESDPTYKSVAVCAYASGQYNPDRVDLLNDLLTLTFAGYDTTAHTLAFCFSELARNPDVQEELFRQVRDVLGPPPVDPSTITHEKLAKIPYLTAVYRETMRKYPAVVFIPVHVNKDTPVDGTIVPAGAEIWCNLRGLQMNPRVFPDPDKFDPTRWLENSFNDQHTFPELSFTLGQHSCLGKNLAILELRTVIACTVNEFKCTLKPGNRIETKVVLTTKPRYGVWAQFERRRE